MCDCNGQQEHREKPWDNFGLEVDDVSADEHDIERRIELPRPGANLILDSVIRILANLISPITNMLVSLALDAGTHWMPSPPVRSLSIVKFTKPTR
jgi:hypothetical protein